MAETKLLLKDITTNGNQRTSTDKAKDRELAESIKSVGIIQPIAVRKENGKFVVIAGHRRIVAAKLAGLKEVPVHVLNVSKEEAYVPQLIENTQRADINVLDEAEAYAVLMRRVDPDALVFDKLAGGKLTPSVSFHKALKSVSKETGKTVKHIANTVRLLELGGQLKKWLKQGTLTKEQGLLILTVPKEKWPMIESEIVDTIRHRHEDYEHTLRTNWLVNLINQKIKRSLNGAYFDIQKEVAGIVACSSCPNNTANHGLLFPVGDTKGDPTCRDSKCFQKKTNQYWRDSRLRLASKEPFKTLRFLGFKSGEYELPKQFKHWNLVELAKAPKKLTKEMGWLIAKKANKSIPLIGVPMKDAKPGEGVDPSMSRHYKSLEHAVRGYMRTVEVLDAFDGREKVNDIPNFKELILENLEHDQENVIEIAQRIGYLKEKAKWKDFAKLSEIQVSRVVIVIEVLGNQRQATDYAKMPTKAQSKKDVDLLLKVLNPKLPKFIEESKTSYPDIDNWASEQIELVTAE